MEILRIITEPGDRVVVNTPGHPPFFSGLERIRRRVVTSPLAHGPGGHRLDLNRLEHDFASGARGRTCCATRTTPPAWSSPARTALDGNRRLLADRLAGLLPGVGHHPPQGGCVAWLDCRSLGLGDDPAQAFLDEGRVGLSSGPRFGPDGRGFVRLNFATSPDRPAEAVERMAAVAGQGRTAPSSRVRQ
ncbi:hypothetical protein [Nonomuraea sp. NPDC049758]|uniref:hypothetical protein n=1 Tax=Nonomuraea sp. NPDC049758 TaxID=3154360 RepID=UPI00342B0D74